MHYLNRLLTATFALTLVAVPALSEDAETKAASITQMLVTLCLAGGSESVLTAEGNVELRSKIKARLSG